MRTKQSKIYILAESAIMLALATVLSLLKLAKLPYGGSITLASMLPVALIAYRHGIVWGISSAFVYGVIQQLLGLSNLSHFTSPVSIVAIILLDYIVAFAVIGLAGIFKKIIKNQSISLAAGCFLACLLRYICHVISGATVWAGISIPTAAALGYSFIYNATYMIPETIVLVLTAYYLGDAVDFSEKMPKRTVHTSKPASDILRVTAGGALLAGIIYDTVTVFGLLQDGETGEFDFTALSRMSSGTQTALFIVSGVTILIFVILLAISTHLQEKD